MAWTTQKSNAFTGTVNTALQTHDTDWAIQSTSFAINGSNQLKSTGGGKGNVAYLSGVTLADKQAAAIDLHNTSNFNGVGCRFGSQVGTAEDYDAYWAFVNGSTAYLYRRDYTGSGGSFTLLDSQSVSWSAGDVLRIEADGSSITTLKNGSATGMPSATDANHSSGVACIRCYGSYDPLLDNFLAEDEAAGGGATFKPPSGLSLLGVGV